MNQTLVVVLIYRLERSLTGADNGFNFFTSTQWRDLSYCLLTTVLTLEFSMKGLSWIQWRKGKME